MIMCYGILGDSYGVKRLTTIAAIGLVCRAMLDLFLQVHTKRSMRQARSHAHMVLHVADKARVFCEKERRKKSMSTLSECSSVLQRKAMQSVSGNNLFVSSCRPRQTLPPHTWGGFQFGRPRIRPPPLIPIVLSYWRTITPTDSSLEKPNMVPLL